MSFRAVETLRKLDLLLCEDTRHSQKLLHAHDIQVKTKSYHQFNEQARLEEILESLEEGKEIGLVSDAGTPGISDPGERLVKACRERGLPLTALPGPCAVTTALSASGLPTAPFQFLAFLPQKDGELRRTLASIAYYRGTTVVYESPHRIEKTLRVLDEVLPRNPLVVARELSKKFESYISGTASELLQEAQLKPFKGEIVLLVGYREDEKGDESLSPMEYLKQVEKEFGLSKKEAIKMTAERFGVKKQEIYKQQIQEKGE